MDIIANRLLGLRRAKPALRSAGSRLLLAAAAVFAVSTARATNYYWDNNGSTPGFGTAGGTWAAPTTGNSTQGWSTSNSGNVTVSDVTTTTADPLLFGTATTGGLAAGTINVSGTVIGRSITVGALSGAITLSGGTITMNQTAGSSFITNNSPGMLTIGSNLDFGSTGSYRTVTGNVTINGNISATTNDARIIIGSATTKLTLGGNMTGTTSISVGQGTVFVGAANISLGQITNEAGSGVGGVFDLNGYNVTVAGLRGGGTRTTTVTDNSAGSGTSTLTLNFTGAAAGGGAYVTITDGANKKVALTKANSGTQVLSEANTYSGATTNSAGILSLTNSLALQNSPLDTTNSTNGSLTVGIQTNQAALTLGGLTGTKNLSSLFVTGTGNYTTVNALTLNPGTGASYSYSGNITEGATGMTLTKTGAGTQILSGNNTYTGGTTISAGTLQLDGSTASTSTVAIGTAGTLSGNGTVNGNATLTGGGIINKSSGTIVGTLGVTGGNWNGNGSVTGVVTSSSGTFTIGSGANLTANGGMNVTGGMIAAGNSTSTITGNVNYTSSNSSSFGGVIAGSAKTLTMNATGATLTLSGNNTYTGTTNVNAGTLLVNGNQSSANGNVTVASGATLGGNGTNGGATTIAGIASPGDGGIGTLNIGNNVTWQGASSNGTSTDWIFQLGAGNSADLLNITGDFLKDATTYGTNFRFNFGGATSTGTFKLVDWSGNTTFSSASDFSFTNLGAGLTGSFAFTGSQLEFTSFSAIPETSTWVGMVALAFSAGAMSLHRQRRNNV